MFLSILSLGFQVHNSKVVPVFEKFFVPVRLSDYDYRVMSANDRMVREAIQTHDGIGVPFIKKLSDDHQRITVWVIISDESLPRSYDDRKKALEGTAYLNAVFVASEFDMELGSDVARRAISVEFWTFKQLASKEKAPTPYAELKNGEFTFH